MKLLELWKWFRRMIGFPGFDHQVIIEDYFRITDYRYHIMHTNLRQEVHDWLDESVGEKNWRVDIRDDDSLIQELLSPYVVFDFRYARHAVWFKSTWG